MENPQPCKTKARQGHQRFGIVTPEMKQAEGLSWTPREQDRKVQLLKQREEETLKDNKISNLKKKAELGYNLKKNMMEVNEYHSTPDIFRSKPNDTFHWVIITWIILIIILMLHDEFTLTLLVL